VLPLTIPPLRLRREDIPHLLRHFLAACRRRKRTITGIRGEARSLTSPNSMARHIRQLENTVYRAVVMSEKDQLGLSDFPQVPVSRNGRPAGAQRTADRRAVDGARHVFG